MEIKGKIIKVTEKVTGTSQKGEWSKYTIVIDTETKYNNIYAIDIFNDKVEQPAVNDMVNVDFNIQCREYQGKYYTNLQIWKLEKSIEVDNTVVNDIPNDGLPF